MNLSDNLELTVLTTEATKTLDSEFRITTHTGIKVSAALYRKYYLAVKALSEKRDDWHSRVKEAVFRMGLPEPKPTDAVLISLVGTKGSRELTLAKMQSKLAEGNPALMAFLAEAEKQYRAQPVQGGKQTVRIVDK